MSDRDIKPAKVITGAAYLGQRRPYNDRELDALLERGELRHDDGEDRRGRWGFRRG